MKISVITVSYNSSATISDTLTSVRNQSYENVEHILVDGASTDNTLEVIKLFPHVAKILSEPDKGLYDAMNKGIAMATGDVIGILNSDDIFVSKNILQQVADAFQNNPGKMVLYGDISYFNTNDMDKVVRYYKTKPYYPRFFEQGNMPPHPSLFIKKIVYDTIGTYKAYYKICADQEFMIRLLKVHSYASIYLDFPIVKMRLGGLSNKGIKSYIFNTVELIKAWNDNGLNYSFYLFLIRPIKKIRQLIVKR